MDENINIKLKYLLASFLQTVLYVERCYNKVIEIVYIYLAITQQY